MHRVPRQASSSSRDTPSSSSAPTSSPSSSGSSESQTPSTSSTSVSRSVQLTTSSSSTSTETSSTFSPTSTSPFSTTIPSTTPTSTPTSTPSQTISSSTSTSFSSTTTTSQQGTPTTVTSAYTTYINGTPVVTTTTFPSTIPYPPTPSSSSNNRTAIIAGAAAGSTALFLLLLTLAFCIRRQRSKRLHFLDTITLSRKRATFLDGEDLDPPQPYTDAPWRFFDPGSAFHEHVAQDGDGSDLARIVEDVMGPARDHYSERSIASVYRGSVGEMEGLLHSRTVSDASHAALLEAAGLAGGHPVRSSPLADTST